MKIWFSNFLSAWVFSFPHLGHLTIRMPLCWLDRFLFFWFNCQTLFATVLMGSISVGFCVISIKIAMRFFWGNRQSDGSIFLLVSRIQSPGFLFLLFLCFFGDSLTWISTEECVILEAIFRACAIKLSCIASASFWVSAYFFLCSIACSSIAFPRFSNQVLKESHDHIHTLRLANYSSVNAFLFGQKTFAPFPK